MTLSSTAEGAHKQMEAYLDQMIDPIVGFLKDSVLNPLFSTIYMLFCYVLEVEFRIKQAVDLNITLLRRIDIDSVN